MSAPAPIPLTILAGATGAGKTRLLNAVLDHPDLAGSLVVLNEAGGTALQGQEAGLPDGDLIQPTGRCLCCAGSGELPVLLETLLRRRDNHRMPDFRQLIIEAAGEADPLPMLASVFAHPYLSLRFRLTGVSTLIAADGNGETRPVLPARLHQIVAADRIVLAGNAGADVCRVLHDINPQAEIIPLEAALAAPGRIFPQGGFDPARKPEAFRRRFYGVALRPGAR